MEWLPNETLRDKILEDIKGRFGERDGIHLSDLTLCLRKPFFRKTGLAPPITEQQALLYISGFAFQKYLITSDEKVFTLDGINCTPDYFGPDNELIEIKSTRASSKDFKLTDMQHWIKQILGYQKVLGPMGISKVDLVILHLMGDWHPPFPSLDVWTVEASQNEVEANWREMLKRKIVLEKSLKDGIPPSTEFTEPWERKY